jgi:hypothetical protein
LHQLPQSSNIIWLVSALVIWPVWTWSEPPVQDGIALAFWPSAEGSSQSSAQQNFLPT